MLRLTVVFYVICICTVPDKSQTTEGYEDDQVCTWRKREAILLAGDPFGSFTGHVEEAEQNLGHLQVGLP
jgi:hypothetical protein